MFQKLVLNSISKFCLFVVFFFGGLYFVNAEVVSPTSEFYVNDYANVLSRETENYILNMSLALEKKDGTQFVVVTIRTLGDMSIEEYAYEYFNTYGLGSANENNGLLFLLVVEDRMFRVEVGDGLEGILPDGKTGRLQDEYMIPYFKESMWNEGIRKGYDAFYEVLSPGSVGNIDVDGYTVGNRKVYTKADMKRIIIQGSVIMCMLFSQIAGKASRKSKVVGYVYLACLTLAAIFVKTNLVGGYEKSCFKALLLSLIIFLIFKFLNVPVNMGGGYRSHGSGSGSGFSSRGGGGRSSGGGSSRRF